MVRLFTALTLLLFGHLAGAADVSAAPENTEEKSHHLVELDDAELFLVRYMRQVRALGKKKGGQASYANYGMPEHGYQQYFLPHPGQVLNPTAPAVGAAIPPMDRVDPYSVEGFYAPALWRDEYMANRHIGVAPPAVAHVSPHPNVYATAPRMLKKNRDDSSYYGMHQYFLPHPGKNLAPFESVDYSRYVVLGGPHEFGTGLHPDRYRTDSLPSGGGDIFAQRMPPSYADMDGIFPSPGYVKPREEPPEYISALYHPHTPSGVHF